MTMIRSRHRRLPRPWFAFTIALALACVFPPPCARARTAAGRQLLDSGAGLFRQGRYAEALAAFRKATEQDPGSIKAWENLGWAHLKIGEYEKAQKIWEMLLKVEPGQPQVMAAIGTANLEQGKWRQAAEWFLKAQHSDPSRVDVLLLLGDAYKAGGQFDRAVESYRQAFERSPGDTGGLLRLANVLDQMGRSGEAARLLEKHQALFRQGDAAAPRMLARLYAEQGNRHYHGGFYDQAADAYDRALRWDPQSSQALKSLGWAYWHQSKWRQCENTWRLYAQRYPDQVEPFNLLSRYYIQRQAFPEAVAAADRSLSLKKDQPLVALRRVQALFQEGRYEMGARQAQRLAEQYPSHLSINKYWAEILMRYQDFERGEKQWRKVLDMGLESSAGYYFWLKSMHENGRQDLAVEKAKAYMAERGDTELLLQLLCDDAAARGDLPQAAAFARRILALPEAAQQPRKWIACATLYQKSRLDEVAEQVLQDALARHPGHTGVILALAEQKLAMKKFDTAFSAFNGIYRQYPYCRRAYVGIYQSLVATMQYQAAYDMLGKNEPCFFTGHELLLEKEKLSVLMGARATQEVDDQQDDNGATYIPALLYHGLSRNERSASLPVRLFEQQMTALRRAGYTPITARQLDAIARQGAGMPDRPVMITMDDARRDAFELADPILEKYGMRATMFAPTALMAPGHPFFSDWTTLNKYHRSGRWDIQSHGHQAHIPITIDASGRQGVFLSDYQWLSDPLPGRRESRDDFARRVEEDYVQTQRLIARHIAGAKVVGYAFPYSEAGQNGEGKADGAWRINKLCIDRHYRFGFIQDESGYNCIERGEDAPAIMRRFTVPSNWTGDDLLRHLQIQHPVHRRMFERAKIFYAKGQYEKARDTFARLRQAAPAMDQEVQYYRAAIAYQQGRYQAASRAYARVQFSAEQIRDTANSNKLALGRSIQWKTAARLTPRFSCSTDSDERQTWALSTRLDAPLKNEKNFWATAGWTRFEEDGQAGVGSEEITMGLNWLPVSRLSISTSARFRHAQDADDSLNGWMSARYGDTGQSIGARASRSDVDTLQARKADISTDSLGMDYARLLPNAWRLRLSGDSASYSDGNHRYDANLRIEHPLPKAPRWSGGLAVAYKDAQHDETAYYTPHDLFSTHLTGAFRYSFDRLSLNFRAGLGGVKEAGRSLRPGGYASMDFEKEWRENCKIFLELDYGNTSSYNRFAASAGLSYRY